MVIALGEGVGVELSQDPTIVSSEGVFFRHGASGGKESGLLPTAGLGFGQCWSGSMLSRRVGTSDGVCHQPLCNSISSIQILCRSFRSVSCETWRCNC